MAVCSSESVSSSGAIVTFFLSSAAFLAFEMGGRNAGAEIYSPDDSLAGSKLYGLDGEPLLVLFFSPALLPNNPH